MIIFSIANNYHKYNGTDELDYLFTKYYENKDDYYKNIIIKLMDKEPSILLSSYEQKATLPPLHLATKNSDYEMMEHILKNIDCINILDDYLTSFSKRNVN